MRFHDLRLARRALTGVSVLSTTSLFGLVSLVTLAPRAALAQTLTVDGTPTGAPPADETALVTAPTAPAAPAIDAKANDSESATVSAGGQLSTGNSKLVAGTANGIYAIRRGQNAFGASIIGNYGESAVRPANPVLTTENVQGKIRYDRFVSDRLSFFGLVTGRHDYFQGLAFRVNADPGAKYILVKTEHTAFWGELGYDFQQDIREDKARHIGATVDATGAVTSPAYAFEKYHPDHSTRLYAGWHHDFNEHVNFTTGLEYLQSLEATQRYRLNYDVLLAAGIGAGFSFGVGFSARYDHSPLPDKVGLDTITTLSLIYAFTGKKADAAPAAIPSCPCTEVNPAPASSGGAPATAPSAGAPAATPSTTGPAVAPAPANATAPDGTNTTTTKPQNE